MEGHVKKILLLSVLTPFRQPDLLVCSFKQREQQPSGKQDPSKNLRCAWH